MHLATLWSCPAQEENTVVSQALRTEKYYEKWGQEGDRLLSKEAKW